MTNQATPTPANHGKFVISRVASEAHFERVDQCGPLNGVSIECEAPSTLKPLEHDMSPGTDLSFPQPGHQRSCLGVNGSLSTPLTPCTARKLSTNETQTVADPFVWGGPLSGDT